MKIDRTAFLTLASLVATGAALSSSLAGCTITSVTNNGPDGGSNTSDAAATSDGGSNSDSGAIMCLGSSAATSDAGSDAGDLVGPTCESITGPCANAAGSEACFVASFDGSPEVFAAVHAELAAKTGTCTDEEASAIYTGAIDRACPDATAEALCDAVATTGACAGEAIPAADIATCKRAIIAANLEARNRFQSCMVEGAGGASEPGCAFTTGASCFPLLQPSQ